MCLSLAFCNQKQQRPTNNESEYGINIDFKNPQIAKDLLKSIDILENSPLEKTVLEFKRLSNIIHSIDEHLKNIDPKSLQDTASIQDIISYVEALNNWASYSTMLNDLKQKEYWLEEYKKLLDFIQKIPLFNKQITNNTDIQTKLLQSSLKAFVLKIQSNIAWTLSDRDDLVSLDLAQQYAQKSLSWRKLYNLTYQDIDQSLSSTKPHLNISNTFIHKAEVLRNQWKTSEAIHTIRKALDHLYQIKSEDDPIIINNILYCYVLLFQYGEDIDLLSISKKYSLFSTDRIQTILWAINNNQNLSLNQIQALEWYKQMLDTWIKICEELDQQKNILDWKNRSKEIDTYHTYAHKIQEMIQSYLQTANAKKEAYELQNEKLRKQHTESQDANRRQKILILFSFLWLVVLSGVAYVIRRSRQEKIRDNKTIAEQKEELQAFNKNLEKRVDDQTRDLKETAIKLQELIEIISWLRRPMEHIVKSPIMRLKWLHMLLWYCENWSSEHDEITRQIQDAHQESKMMIHGLTKMFEIYRTDFNDVFFGENSIDRYHREQLIPKELFEEIHGQALQSALHISYADDFPEVLILKLSQDVYDYLMECVLDNAYKFSSSQAISDPDHIQCINVSFAVEKKRLIVTVQDNGIWIHSNYLIDTYHGKRLKTTMDIKRKQQKKWWHKDNIQEKELDIKTLDMIGARWVERQFSWIKWIKTTSWLGLAYLYQLLEKLQGSCSIRPNENGQWITVTFNLPIIA